MFVYDCAFSFVFFSPFFFFWVGAGWVGGGLRIIEEREREGGGNTERAQWQIL